MKKAIFLFVALFMFLGSTALAVQLQAIRTLSLKEVNFSYNAKGRSATGAFVIKNTLRHQVSDFAAFVSFVDTKTQKEILRKNIQTEKISVPSMSHKKVDFKISDINLPKGSFDVNIALTQKDIGTVSVKRAGTLKIVDSDVPPSVLMLDCTKDSALYNEAKRELPIRCSVSGYPDDNSGAKEYDKVTISYEVRDFGSGELLLKDVVKRVERDENSNGKFSFVIPLKFDKSGPVDIAIKYKDASGSSNTAYTRFNIPGDFSKIVTLEYDKQAGNIDIYLNGNLYKKYRRLMLGLYDTKGECFVHDESLNSLAPLKRKVKVADNDCQNAKAFAVVYLHGDSDKSLKVEDILDYKGLSSLQDALATVSAHYKTDTVGAFGSVMKWLGNSTVLAAILAFVAVLILLIALNKLSKKHITGILLTLIAFTTPYFASAEIFDAADAPKVRFEVNFPNLENKVGQNDNITFSFAALDNFNGSVSKYPGASAYLKIDSPFAPNEDESATGTKIMDSADNKSSVLVSLPNSLSLGTHTLYFRAPNLCGSAFDFSDFNNARFDPEDCDFAVDFEVVPGSNLSLTFYAQPKAVQVGSSSKLYWFSTGANSCVASGAWSGSQAMNNTSGADTGPINSASEDFTLTCSNNDESISRTDTVYTYDCGDNFCSQWESCNICSQDCGQCSDDGTLSIEADPKLLKEGSKTYIRWKSDGFDSCTVTEDNPNINDSWTRLAGFEISSPIDKDTVYTLKCNGSGGSKEASVKIRVVPRYIEF